MKKKNKKSARYRKCRKAVKIMYRKSSKPLNIDWLQKLKKCK